MPRRKRAEKASGDATYRLWQDRVHKTLEWRKNYWNGDRRWDRSLRLYRGDHWSTWLDSGDSRLLDLDVSSALPRDQVVVQLTQAVVTDFVAFLVARDPFFLAKPTLPHHADSAKVQQALLNTEWREKEVTAEVERVAYDMAIIGHGVMKTGYTIDLDDDVQPDKDGLVEMDKYIRSEDVWARRVNPYYFVWDITAPDQTLRTARWCAELIFRPLQDVLADSRYNQAVRSAIASGKEAPTRVKTFLSERVKERDAESTGLHDRVVLYEIWDWKFQKRYVFADNVVRPLVEEDWPHSRDAKSYLDGFPYVMEQFTITPNEPYGQGLPALIEDQQFELNDIRSKNFAHRRKFNRVYTMRRGTVTETELAKLQDAEDGSIIVVEEEGALQPLQDAPESVDVDRTEGRIQLDIDRVTGADQLQQGGRLPSRTSASEIQARITIFGRKIDLRARTLDRMVLTVGRQLLQHIKANFELPRIVRAAGRAGLRSDFLRFSPQQIQQEVDIELQTSAAPKADPDLERQQAIQFLQVISAFAQVFGPQIVGQFDPIELMRWALEKFEDTELERFFPAAGTLPAPIPAPDLAQGGSAEALPRSNLAENPVAGRDIGSRVASARAANPSSAASGAALGSLSGGTGQ